VVSIYGFVGLLGPAEGALPEPTRIASNIVTGIGFLGAGAILKYGTAIHGLTTAASLWATAAVGLAIGTGSYVVGLVAAAIALVSLWPLQRVTDRVRTRRRLRVRIGLKRMDALGEVFESLTGVGADIEGVRMKRSTDDQFEIELQLHLARGHAQGAVASALSSLPDVQLLESEREAE
jgi:putative Mg2+ transporter-C (MgtC) family protein